MMDRICTTCGRQTGLWGGCSACGVSTTPKAVFRDTLALTGILIGVLIVMGVVVSQVSGNPLQIFQKLGIWQPDFYEVNRASKNLPVPKNPQETISPQRIAELRELFENSQFESLNYIYENYHLRSRIHFEKKDFEAAADDLQTAYHLNPTNAEILRWQEWAATHLLNLGHNIFKTDLNQAVEKYHFSLMFDPENTEAYYWRTVAYWHQNRLDLAMDDLKKSCDMGNKEACDRYLQAKNQKAN